MEENSAKIDLKELFSYCQDLLQLLKDNKDFDTLTYCVDQSNSIHSSFLSHFTSTHLSLSDYEKNIDDCKHKIEATQSEEISEEEIDGLQKELDDELKREQLLREELRVIVGEISDLDNQRVSIEEKSRSLKKLEEEQEKDRLKLSFYASATKIVPDLEMGSKISGHIVERDKKKLEKFEFDPLQEDGFDICNKTWKMINL